MRFSIVIPVYRNEHSLVDLLAALKTVAAQIGDEMEVVFVVDGSPDGSFARLQAALPSAGFASQLILLSRNFGSFSAIAAGLAAARGEYFAVIAADLQEPPSLTTEFFEVLQKGDYDLVLGKREGRNDPLITRFMSGLFWRFYRRFVQTQMPKGGVDVFGCTRRVRDELLKLHESNSTLVGLLMWIGFRRTTVSYTRAVRRHGRSAWSFGRKVRYLKDSIFAFSDLPVRVLGFLGALGMFVSIILGFLIVAARITGKIDVPGYAASATLIMFFGGLNSLGIAILGEYLWRTFENTKQRPPHIVVLAEQYAATQTAPNE